VDEGSEKVLDVLQDRACVRTLFLASIHLQSSYRRVTDAGPAAARSRQAGVRSQFFTGGELRHPSSPVLQGRASQRHSRARPRLRYPGRRAPCRQKARHEGHVLARGRVSYRLAEHRKLQRGTDISDGHERSTRRLVHRVRQLLWQVRRAPLSPNCRPPHRSSWLGTVSAARN
jgi:hypothetical protein